METTLEISTEKKKKKKGKKKKKLDKYHWHEALDRTDMIRNIIEDNLSEHPVIKSHPSMKEKLDKVQEILGDLYLEIGEKH